MLVQKVFLKASTIIELDISHKLLCCMISQESQVFANLNLEILNFHAKDKKKFQLL